MDTYTSTTGEESCRLQLSDVYEIATSVGQEFQRLIGEFGSTTMSVLVSTVVGALEHLEVYVEEYQKLRTQNCKLRLENDHLATEKDDGKKLAAKNEVSNKQYHVCGPLSADGFSPSHISYPII